MENHTNSQNREQGNPVKVLEKCNGKAEHSKQKNFIMIYKPKTFVHKSHELNQ